MLGFIPTVNCSECGERVPPGQVERHLGQHMLDDAFTALIRLPADQRAALCAQFCHTCGHRAGTPDGGHYRHCAHYRTPGMPYEVG